MSRMTAAQVVQAGDYLQPDFEPSSLTVNQLLGVFGYHNIMYPTTYTKPKLLQLFNETIKANRTQLMKERLKRQNSDPSDDGITDGVTGQLLTERSEPARRSSRRLSRAPPDIPSSDEPSRPDPPKRRRSSAEPTLGGPSRRKAVAPAEPILAEESEPEDEPVRKPARTKKAQPRRETPPPPEFGEDSGWEDNNVFQSGAESSPARRSPAKRSVRKPAAPRAAIAPRRGRKATSAPPEGASMSPVRTEPSTARIVPQSDFKPQLLPSTKEQMRNLPSIPPHSPAPQPVVSLPSVVMEEDEEGENLEVPMAEEEPPVRKPLVSRKSPTPAASEDPLAYVSMEAVTSQETNPPDEKDDGVASEVAAVSKRIAEGGKQVVRHTKEKAQSASLVWRIALGLILFLASAGVFEFKNESAFIGFCDTGSSTNDVLEQQKLHRQAVEACNLADSPYLHPPIAEASASDSVIAHSAPCPPPALIPLPHPTACTPCPQHGSCSRHTVVCDAGYLLKPHPLLALLPAPPPSSPSADSDAPVSAPAEFVWRAISAAFDGLPMFGPVAFPPRCADDPRRKQNIGNLGKVIESYLGQERGRRLCSGEGDALAKTAEDGGEARRWGVEVEWLKGVMREKMEKLPELVARFDEYFHEAMQELLEFGSIITGEDAEGKKYLAHESPDLSWNCALTVKARNTWHEWRLNILGTLLTLIGLRFTKQMMASRRVQDKRIAGLVQIALEAIRNQELAHYTDPVGAPYPYLSSIQLRDLVLQDEHSVGARARLWDRVERVVEGNANVRANLEEVEGGDELRVWRWIGSGGRRQIQPAEQDEEAPSFVEGEADE